MFRVMVVQERLYTAKDLERLPDDGNHYELDRGILIVMPPTKREHGLVQAEALALIHNHVRAHDLGQVGQGLDVVDQGGTSVDAAGRSPRLLTKTKALFMVNPTSRRSSRGWLQLSEGGAGAP